MHWKNALHCVSVQKTAMHCMVAQRDCPALRHCTERMHCIASLDRKNALHCVSAQKECATLRLRTERMRCVASLDRKNALHCVFGQNNARHRVIAQNVCLILDCVIEQKDCLTSRHCTGKLFYIESLHNSAALHCIIAQKG